MIPDIYKVELIGSGSLSVMAKPVSGEWIEDEFPSIPKKDHQTRRGGYVLYILIVSFFAKIFLFVLY
jgi:hypothetical protein